MLLSLISTFLVLFTSNDHAWVLAKSVHQPEMKIRALWEQNNQLSDEGPGFKAVAEVVIQFPGFEGIEYEPSVKSSSVNVNEVVPDQQAISAEVVPDQQAISAEVVPDQQAISAEAAVTSTEVPVTSSGAPSTKPAPFISSSAAPEIPPENISIAENLLSNNQSDSCDKGYIRSNSTNSCYKVHDIRTNWSLADVTCREEGANLLVINDKVEADFITTMTSAVLSFEWCRVGVRLVNGTWIDVFGESIEQLYHAWHWMKDDYESNDCLYINLYDGKLTNGQCTEQWPFICEKFDI